MAGVYIMQAIVDQRIAELDLYAKRGNLDAGKGPSSELD